MTSSAPRVVATENGLVFYDDGHVALSSLRSDFHGDRVIYYNGRISFRFCYAYQLVRRSRIKLFTPDGKPVPKKALGRAKGSYFIDFERNKLVELGLISLRHIDSENQKNNPSPFAYAFGYYKPGWDGPYGGRDVRLAYPLAPRFEAWCKEAFAVAYARMQMMICTGAAGEMEQYGRASRSKRPSPVLIPRRALEKSPGEYVLSLSIEELVPICMHNETQSFVYDEYPYLYIECL